MRETIQADGAPDPVGAYSQATTDGDRVFVAGQVGLTSDGESLESESIAIQTEQALRNVEAILEAAGTDLDHVLKTTVFLADIEEFEEMNETYAAFFDRDPPARSAVEASALGFEVEIEAIATYP